MLSAVSAAYFRWPVFFLCKNPLGVFGLTPTCLWLLKLKFNRCSVCVWWWCLSGIPVLIFDEFLSSTTWSRACGGRCASHSILAPFPPITYSPTHPLHSIHHHGDGTRQESVIWGMYSFTLFTAPAISGMCMNATVPALWVCFLFQSEHATHANERLSTLVLSPDWQKDVHSNRSGLDRQLLFQFAFKGEIKQLSELYIQIALLTS